MLSKYLARTEFLSNSLFRFTQPGALNDRREGLPRLVLGAYSDEDREEARRHARSVAGLAKIDDDDVERFFLEPYPSRRFDEGNFPGLWPMREPRLRDRPFNTVAEFDEAMAERLLELIFQLANESIGLFCLTTRPSDALAAYYGADGRGVRVDFDDRHPFFLGARPVEYRDGIAVSSNGGILRLGGYTVDVEDILARTVRRLHPDLFWRKSPDWAHESEVRLVRPLLLAHSLAGKDHRNFTVNLFEVPSDATLAVTIGPDMPSEAVDQVVAAASAPRWHHLRVVRQEATIRGVREAVLREGRQNRK